MQRAIAFASGILVGATAHHLARGLRPEPKTTFRSPDGVPPVGSEPFEEALTALTQSASETGNALRLFDGRDAYIDELLDAIEGAGRSIWFEIFYWREGRFASLVTERLLDALARGVEVRLIVDGYGGENGRLPTLDALRRAGADVAVYSPLRPWAFRRLNKRTHRRILIVDQSVGYTGGVGIDDRWLGAGETPPWADVLLRVRGPAVRRLAGIFADHWRIITGDPLARAPALRRHPAAGEARVQVLQSGPESGAAGMRLALLYALEAARERVRIATPYFIPDRLMIDQLVSCRRRGVEVELVLPSAQIDHPIVRRASRTTWGPLLRAGIVLFEHQPTLVHTKTLLVDDAWALIGTMNVDERSFRLNAEIAVGTSDPGVVRTLGESLDRYQADSVRIGLDDWQDRPVTRRAGDQMAGILRAQF